MVPPPMRECPGAAIKTEADIQTDYPLDGPYMYFLNDRNGSKQAHSIYGLVNETS
jgi:hypothetical protein